MHRLNQAFLVVTISLALLGGVSVFGFMGSLGDVQDAGLIESQVQTDVVAGEVVDGEFLLRVEIRNPTRFSIDLNGAYTTVSADGDRVAYGTIVNHGEIPSEIPARETVTVDYAFALSDEQAEELQAAMDEGTVQVSGQHAVKLKDTKFSISFTGEVGGA